MKYDTIRTTLDPEAVRKALTDAWTIRFSVQPSSDSISVLLSQIAQETGWRACWNWNLGNVKAAAGQDFCELDGVWEIVNGQRVELPKGAPGTQFRAFPTLEAGVTAYLNVMTRRFSSAWIAVLAGDPFEFAVLLKKANYYTAPVEDYARGLVNRFEELREPALRTQAQIILVLNRLGYATTNYIEAVKMFQKEHMSPADADGIVGPRTRATLRVALEQCS
jgi:hypothetical protein